MKTNARQIICELEKTFKGTPGAVFPMLCPVLEEKWIPGWEYELIHSKSGVNETGCIFQENISGAHLFEEPVTATWVTILHDPASSKVEFIIFYGDRALARSSVQVSGSDKGHVRVQWTKVLTLIDPAKCKFSDPELKQKTIESLSFIAESLSYYFETGHMLKI